MVEVVAIRDIAPDEEVNSFASFVYSMFKVDTDYYFLHRLDASPPRTTTGLERDLPFHL
jgi:hypothetical protein